MNLLSFDPGIRKSSPATGWAWFVSNRLAQAGRMSGSVYTEPPSEKPAALDLRPPLVVIEQPRWYPAERDIDVNDLLDLSVLVGNIQAFYVLRGARVELVPPRSWKGNVRWDITCRRVVQALSEEERAVLPRRPRAKDYDHNVLDSVGLGLWKLGRYR